MDQEEIQKYRDMPLDPFAKRVVAELCSEIEKLRKYDFERDAELERSVEFNYPALAMRTAAGPEVFFWPPSHMEPYFDGYAGGEVKKQEQISKEFLRVLKAFLISADELNRWKSVLFYNKDPYSEKFLNKFENLTKIEPTMINPQLIHAALDIASEAGELLYDAAMAMQTGELDGNINRESGDIDWYQELLASVTGQSTLTNRESGDIDRLAAWYQELLASFTGQSTLTNREQNIDRLAARYPDKFSTVDALERKDEAETAIPKKYDFYPGVDNDDNCMYGKLTLVGSDTVDYGYYGGEPFKWNGGYSSIGEAEDAYKKSLSND